MKFLPVALLLRGQGIGCDDEVAENSKPLVSFFRILCHQIQGLPIVLENDGEAVVLREVPGFAGRGKLELFEIAFRLAPGDFVEGVRAMAVPDLTDVFQWYHCKAETFETKIFLKKHQQSTFSCVDIFFELRHKYNYEPSRFNSFCFPTW